MKHIEPSVPVIFVIREVFACAFDFVRVAFALLSEKPAPRPMP